MFYQCLCLYIIPVPALFYGQPTYDEADTIWIIYDWSMNQTLLNGTVK